MVCHTLEPKQNREKQLSPKSPNRRRIRVHDFGTVLWPAGNPGSKYNLDHDKSLYRSLPEMVSNHQSISSMSPLRALCHRYRNPLHPLPNRGHLLAKHCLYTPCTMCMWLTCHPACPALSCLGQAALNHVCCVALTAPGMTCGQWADERLKALKVPL